MVSDQSSSLEPVYREMADQVMVEVARNLRQHETGHEDMLWSAIRNRRLFGLKFRRQHPIAGTRYVVDFLCYESHLIIELDGKIHQRQIEEDQARQNHLTALGYVIIRFTNDQIFKNLAESLQKIVLACQTYPNAFPLPEGEGQG